MNAISKTNKPRKKKKRIRQVGKSSRENDDAYHFRRQKIANNKLEENNISSSIWLTDWLIM
jgi:hypothetical protein